MALTSTGSLLCPERCRAAVITRRSKRGSRHARAEAPTAAWRAPPRPRVGGGGVARRVREAAWCDLSSTRGAHCEREAASASVRWRERCPPLQRGHSASIARKGCDCTSTSEVRLWTLPDPSACAGLGRSDVRGNREWCVAPPQGLLACLPCLPPAERARPRRGRMCVGIERGVWLPPRACLPASLACPPRPRSPYPHRACRPWREL
jgi:hypothetical protein